MKKQSLPLVLAILLAASLVGCAEISLRVRTETSAPTQVSSSGEQSAAATWDSIPDGVTESTPQTEATQATQIQESIAKEQKKPETTVPAVTEEAKLPEFSTESVENPVQLPSTAPSQVETQPVITTPSETTKPATETKPAEATKPVETTEPAEETVPPKQEEVPQPTTPPETQPSVTEPAEVIDTDDLENYGRSYAESTYGYEARPGVRDGYYPAYSCRIRTMEEGYWAVRGCVDDTTRALLARPNTQIVVEINGVLCRAMIDIEIIPNNHGGYWITVYYG